MTSTDIPIPPAVVEAAARAIERWIAALVDNDTRATELLNEERIILADQALRAGLAAWPGMIDGCTWKNQPPTIILPLTEKPDA